MKCPNCGAEMKEGLLYCEHCGRDIHIVPDFEPELELNMEQALFDIGQDIQDARDEKPKEWQERTPKKQQIEWLLFGGLLILILCGAVAGIRIYRYNSPEYQASAAQRYAGNGQYDKAIACYSRALELEPETVEWKFAMADVYLLKNNMVEYEYMLREIIKDDNASAEDLESAYGKLISIYREREDYKTINQLLLASGNETIISKYQSYIVVEPEFSLKEGYYGSIQPLKLTTFGNGKIYYTLDGSEPTAESSQYTAPILLEEGEYLVKAVYINEKGVASDVVTRVYHIEIDQLPLPEISAVSGDYQFPVNIEITSEAEAVYYTTDGSEPDEQSLLYQSPIPMPLGKSVFSFIAIEDGRCSEVVERHYNLVMNTQFTPEQAVETVIAYSMESGKIYDEIGHFDETAAAYKYEYQYVTNINSVDDFYVIAEILRGADMSLTKTGNMFAVNAYTKELYRLQTIDAGNYVLVEIEK